MTDPKMPCSVTDGPHENPNENWDWDGNCKNEYCNNPVSDEDEECTECITEQAEEAFDRSRGG